MKKVIIPIIIILIVGIFVFLFFNKKESDLKKIKVAEVTHSIFYAPQYVAHALGYFEQERLDVELLLVPGTDKVAASVLSGDVQIGFCGSEATIYIYNQGQEDYLVSFSGLTKRDGSFIVSREKIEDFTLEDLKGKTIIGGRIGGMPEMTLEYTLKEDGIDPKNDLETIIERYKNIDSWFTTTYITEENFNHIQEIAESAGQLDERAPFDKLVNNTYSK